VEVADVSSFAKGANKPEIPEVEIISSLDLPALDASYEEELQFEKAVRPVPRARAMNHPITRWRQPERIEVVAFGEVTDWYES
jgi:hypothetical protein